MSFDLSISSLTTADVISLIVAFVIGLLVGYIVKNAVKIGLAILAIIIILIAIGALSPTTVEHTLVVLGQKLTQAEGEVNSYINLLPYNSIAFIIGFVIGLIKG
ncbi:MAG: hypothetical protein TQ35_0007800 [Candidatus Aramenus sulfurataquae]|jgi:uncharacterized membrane protein (Fun14 family)|uniref:Uncharacterized protein n=2 Tax=Candidatus Aramenus sulfurataquae TaxID=1326980 RepID=A0A0F2LKP1_9CREN|nr:hypothetical protein [Candidatus Aramenus sulfurataquae]